MNNDYHKEEGMRCFSFSQKQLGYGFLLSACLSLQGCHFGQNSSPEVVTNEQSTVVGTPENKPVVPSPDEDTVARPVRATPRRPIVTEEPVFEPVPVEEPTFVPVETGESTTYVVCKGDTLTKIAHRFRVSVLQLMQENQLKNKNKLYVGQVLVIPQKNASFTSPSSETVEPYRVVKGDTLSKIAKRFQISLLELQQLNGLDRNATLSIGQMILVPKNTAASSSGDNDGIYTVQKGDTLGKIAKRFGTTVAKLRKQNHLKSDIIYIGQKLYLSGSAPVKEKKSSSSKSDAAPLDGDTYTVQSGDNLWLIAKRCRRSVAELTELNDLQNPEQLQVGQVLRLKKRSERKTSKSKKTFEPSVRTHSYESRHEKSKKTFDAPVRTRSYESQYEEAPVERVRETESASTVSDTPETSKSTSTFGEDDFKDLFEENKDMPVVPLDVQ